MLERQKMDTCWAGLRILVLLVILGSVGCGAQPAGEVPLPGGPGSVTPLCDGGDPSPEQYRALPVTQGEFLTSLIWGAHAPLPRAGAIFVSGVDGGWIEPADRIYQKLAQNLSHLGVASVFVKYRNPGELGPSLDDASAGADYLRSLGVKQMALLGWSFGGAVITNLAIRTPEVRTLIGFAPQSKDTEAVAQFSRQSIFLIHSRDDENVPFESSQEILEDVPPQVRKRLMDLQGYDHLLTGAGSIIEPEVLQWLKEELGLSG